VRILFQLPYPGYLRIYGSTIELLAERGHTVLLTYDRPGKRRDATADETESHERVELVPPLPPARRRGERAVEALRLTTDYLRYLDPRFADSTYLRHRLDPYLPRGARFLARVPPGRIAQPALRGLLVLERLVPSDGGIERALEAHGPDAIVVTPLIGRTPAGVRQTDTVKAARKLGIPVGLAVASWDHLTTKGLVKEQPDLTFVWNEFQVREAVELHGLPVDRVVATGAQLFDPWFERRPSVGREEFLGRVGLDAAAYVLYVGSSRNIAPAAKEIPFVLRWLEALRAAEPAVGVAIRPHPGNMAEWAQVSLPVGNAAIVPRKRPALPMSETDSALYFDSIHFATAVVGINTSAMVESFIQSRPVLTIRSPEFRTTQDGTLHFRYLLPDAGGPLRVAGTVEEHLAQLRSALDGTEADHDRIQSFVRAFVRPHGLDRPATPILAHAIEALADEKASRN
jgi:hypothetical protein